MKQALIVVDAQKSFSRRDYWNPDSVDPFIANLNSIIERSEKAGVPIVHVFHLDGNPESPFHPASGLISLLDGIHPKRDTTIFKHVHNAFTDTGLDRWLRERKIEEVIITGIRTEQCCETTTRVASDLGYQVQFVTDATLTFPMVHPVSKNVYSAEMIKERTELVLQNRFAKIVSSRNVELND